MTTSAQAFERAQTFFPGGVNSPVRAFGSVGGTPPFIARAHGSHLWDIEGNEYIDFVGSWGPMILGHANPKVITAIVAAAERGTSFGAPTELETSLAELVVQALPSIEMLRFVNSGTEATMSALRLARGVTGRSKIIKFEGCYHGHADGLLVKAGSGAATHGTPTSAGVTATTANDTIVCGYNNLDQVTATMQLLGSDVAAIIVEPVAGNMGCVPPMAGFLEGLRQVCDRHGAILIFDEVMTGFRVDWHGAQGRFNVRPDLTCLGKIIGGGLPVGAYGGRRDLMEKVAPLGPVYQAGTLSGNPLAMTAGIATLSILRTTTAYASLEATTKTLTAGMTKAITEATIPHRINRVGSMWTLFFTDEPVIDFASSSRTHRDRFRRFFHTMLKAGIYLPPSPFEAAFASTAHTEQDIQKVVTAVTHWASHEP